MTRAQQLSGDIQPPLGWQAKLELGFVRRPSKTVLQKISHQGPLRVQRPFYPESEVPHVYLLHPPGGVVGGDRLDIRVDMAAASQALLTSPGSTKCYRSAGVRATLSQQLTLAEGASLEWFPQENIFFSGARVRVETHINLAADARFMGWEINCMGRPESDEQFLTGEYASRLQITRAGHPLLRECQRVNHRHALQSASGLRGHPIQALFIATPCEASHLAICRKILAQGGASRTVAATLVDGVLLLRALGHQIEPLRQQLILLWQALRPCLLARPAVAPRIWAT